MKPTPEELQKILADHVLWLRGDAAGKRAYLSGADLRSANLSGAYLSGAYLSSADLSGANLSGANLRGADLRSAYLSGANLSSADLSGANLSGADLSSADLSSADLSSADLSSANLSGANLSSADLRSADLRSAYLSGANLSGAYLSGAYQEKNPVPAIAGLHQKILAAIDGGGSLNMSEWHTCETTHCRAGWVVHLAGDVGRVMEHFLSTPVAAALIELASEPALEGKVPDYYTNNEAALADIKRLADIQAKRAAVTA